MKFESTGRTSTQVAAVGMVLDLARDPDIPAVSIDIASDWVCVHVHDNPAGFEWWREALALDPADAELSLFSDFSALNLYGTRGDMVIRLVGYLPLPVADSTPAAAAA